MSEPLSAEDHKLVVLARGAMGRAGGVAAAAVRDTEGRCYAAGPVGLQALSLTALQVAVAAAMSSGATGFEAAVLFGGDADTVDPGIAAVHEVSAAARIVFSDRDGTIAELPQ